MQRAPPGRLGTNTGRMASWPVDVLYGARVLREVANDRRREDEEDAAAAVRGSWNRDDVAANDIEKGEVGGKEREGVR